MYELNHKKKIIIDQQFIRMLKSLCLSYICIYFFFEKKHSFFKFCKIVRL